MYFCPPVSILVEETVAVKWGYVKSLDPVIAIKSTMLVIRKVKVATEINKQNVESLQKQEECLFFLLVTSIASTGVHESPVPNALCAETGMLLGSQVGVSGGYFNLLACSSGPCDFCQYPAEKMLKIASTGMLRKVTGDQFIASRDYLPRGQHLYLCLFPLTEFLNYCHVCLKQGDNIDTCQCLCHVAFNNLECNLGVLQAKVKPGPIHLKEYYIFVKIRLTGSLW